MPLGLVLLPDPTVEEAWVRYARSLTLGLLRYDSPYNAPSAGPATMAWLIVPCSSSLRGAEAAATSLPFVQRARVTTSNGDLFQPHVTRAIWDGEPAPATSTLPKELFDGVSERSLFEAS